MLRLDSTRTDRLVPSLRKWGKMLMRQNVNDDTSNDRIVMFAFKLGINLIVMNPKLFLAVKITTLPNISALQYTDFSSG